MSEIYFVEAIKEHGVFFVKKNDGELVNGDEHDLGMLVNRVYEDDSGLYSTWCFEQITDLRHLTSSDLTEIVAMLFKLNNELMYLENLMPVGVVFNEIVDDGMADGHCFICFSDGKVCNISAAAALEINDKMVGFFDDGE